MSIKANIKTLKEVIDKSFRNELEVRCDYQGKVEQKVLEYLKDVLNLQEYSFFEKYDDAETLYKLALNIKEYNDGTSAYNPFIDYPLCDRLGDVYADFSSLCADYAEEIIDKSQIDLSDLENLKIELASNLITQILDDYRKDVNYLLGKTAYMDKVEFVNMLEEIQYDLPFEIMIEYQKDSRYETDVILLDSIKHFQGCYYQDNFKRFLKNNPDFESDYIDIDEFLELDTLKSEQESTHKKRTRR